MVQTPKKLEIDFYFKTTDQSSFDKRLSDAQFVSLYFLL